MYLLRTPGLLRSLFPKGLRWEGERDLASPKVYLTFDDGPHPQATPFVLDQLRAQGAKGTFFCIGNNVEARPDLYDRILAEGHRTGNHTFNHLNGWKTAKDIYLDDVHKAAGRVDSKLFRPPYGRIKPAQAKALMAEGYQICMWSLLSADFDTELTPERCLENLVYRLRPGDIVVFHDSAKAWPRLEYALPRVLAHCGKQGWECAALDALPG